jgi:hypothetical protein
MTLYAEFVTPDNKVLWSHEATVKSDDKSLPAASPRRFAMIRTNKKFFCAPLLATIPKN